MGSSTVEEKSKAGFRLVNGGRGGASTLLEGMKILQEFQDQSERKKTLNSELWHACAGPLVSLPQIGSRVYYFPQGHSEQVEVSTKGIAGSHIPNYPNLPSQLMCHVQNVTLHADKDTDEIYAQMTLQPMNPEKDVFPVIDFGIRPNKHPSEFFCKTLTASDTSTHGGFSVPRRAAEKLFPPLDYSMQPPTQELVVRDLHDNSWTFRHIYRGQPKRHLLTSGWSLLLSAKRLRAGDAVLFVRDEKSQLRLGVRRANRSQTTLPSSILSVDSMHIGVLAAAAHAAANRSPFTIFYNPRACPSEFVVPLVKYQKAVYGPQVSIGMRFGMMFETEESSKRRYMGMVVGVSDIDPLRWPGSKWRNLQVEWDEPGRKHKRVSPWEIETPESHFVFPSMSSTLKRSLCSGFVGAETEWKKSLIKKPTTGVPGNGNVDFRYPLIPPSSSELVQMLLKPGNVNPVGAFPSTSTVFGGTSNRETQAQTSTEEKPRTLSLQTNLLQNQNPLQNFHEQQQHTMESSLASNGPFSETGKCENQLPLKTHTEKPPIAPVVAQDQQRQLTSLGKSNEDTFDEGLLNCQSQSLESQLLYLNQRQLQVHPGSVQQDTADLHQNFTPQMGQMDRSDLYSLPPCSSNLPSQFTVADDWISNPSSYQSLAGILGSLEPISGSMLQDGTLNPIVCSFGQESWDPQLSYLRSVSHSEEISSCLQQDNTPLQSAANSCVLRDFPEESNDQSEIYSGIHFEVSKGGRAVVDLPFPGSVLDVFSSPGDVGFLTTNNCLGSNISSTQDIQSQITTTSLGDPQGFSLQDFPDYTGGTSSRSSLDFDESSLLQKGPWQQISPPLRTYTKVQMLGSVGRSIDVTKFKNYSELRSAIACMFGVEAFFDDPGDFGWKLVYVDYENDVLLVGDDPWEEFVSCVRCIRILSPSEVQQMSEDGNQLISNTVM